MTQAAKHAPMKLAACENAAARATRDNLANADKPTGRPGTTQNEAKNAAAEAQTARMQRNQLKEKLPAA